jgi:excisionase family DNA binding protein
MSSTAVMEPIGVPEAAEEQVRDLRMTMESGQAVLVGPNGQGHPIPTVVHALFLRVLEFLQAGKAISIIPYMQELTTQDAANVLGISRQYLVRLLDAGEIPLHKVGTHRRIYLRDLLAYKAQRDRQRGAALTELARISLEAGLYDTVEDSQE